jgi:hypothetical protein
MNKRTAIAILTSLLAFHSAIASAGFQFTQVSRSDGQPPMEVKISTDGSSSKIEYVTAMPNNPFFKPGSYMLSMGDEMFLVTPSERTFARFDIAMMQGMAQEMIGGQGGSMFQIKNVKVEKTVDEPGEKVAGYPTRHYQFKSSWTMAMTSMPMSMDSTAVEDYWTTDAIPISLGRGAEVLQASGLPGSARDSEAAKVLKDVKGIPLRQVSLQTTKTNMGGAFGAVAGGMMNKMGGKPTKTTSEITSVQEVDLPASAFEIPEGYREVQLFQQGPAMPDLNSLRGQAPPNLNGPAGQGAPPPNLNSPGGQAAPPPDLNNPR